MADMIVGTAGHVDHGKTCLIKALTGVNTDRLMEEQKRGITIEAGFTELKNEKGIRIGIVDVPGHEKFIKNMLAGIGGIDFVLLVIAADEGIMPQTREHFSILRLLGMKKGLIVLTKCDLAETGWLALVKDEISELVRGSFLEGSPILEVSSVTGQNISHLKEIIIREAETLAQGKNIHQPFRLPIDRVFTAEGFGTVVTGTLMEGACHAGNELMLYPSGKTVKIRGIQVHGASQNEAHAGERTALNLSGIKTSEICRGDTLAAPCSMTPSLCLDVLLQTLTESDRSIKNGSRVHIYIGTAEKTAKVVLTGTELLLPGEKAYARLRFLEEVTAKRGDRFVVRFYSPVETIGGGIVLDSFPPNRKKRKALSLSIPLKDLDNETAALEQMIKESGFSLPTAHALSVRMNLTEEAVKKRLADLLRNHQVLLINESRYLHHQNFKFLQKCMVSLLSDYHRENPLLAGMEREKLKSRLSSLLHITDTKIVQNVYSLLLEQKQFVEKGSLVTLSGYSSPCSGKLEESLHHLAEYFQKAGFLIPDIERLPETFGNKKQRKLLIEQLCSQGILVKVKYPYYIYHIFWEKALSLLDEYREKKEEIVLGEFRDRLGITRKYAMLLLDAFDERRLTKKCGDIRRCL